MRDVGFVYFMRGDVSGLIKIGFTANDVESRRKQVQRDAGEPVTALTSMPGTMVVERHLHEQFAASRVRGEWFTPTPDLFKVMEIEDLGEFLVAAFNDENFRSSPLQRAIEQAALAYQDRLMTPTLAHPRPATSPTRRAQQRALAHMNRCPKFANGQHCHVCYAVDGDADRAFYRAELAQARVGGPR